ncbi:unnamed protein product [Nippostrongylus brasiliensis]|uniref:Uncharacterized protein n=1 Tax=Nippostrongylus brasiliensis TaxID=27835 RepID=A0A158QWS3_NIPBR|nr:unnamed protein product [Nippostrongylus brasiliensis]
MHLTEVIFGAISSFQCQANWVSQLKSHRAQILRPSPYTSDDGVRPESFAPRTISDVTGKVNQQRRQMFSWQPQRLSDFFRR